MATKTASVLARIEPEVKEQAESIMEQLGIPASVVINMLYKQIIITKGIPFSLKTHYSPITQDDMDESSFNSIMQLGYEEARANRSRPLKEAFSTIRQELS